MKSSTLIFVLVFLSIAINLSAQTDKTNSRTATRAFVNCDSIFPKCFIGNWKGKLQWMIAGKPAQEFTMQLNIQPADSAGQYTWQIIYGDDNKDSRPYILKPADTAKGHWVIDEQNGIILDSYVHGNSVHGAFTVKGNTIVNNYKIMEGMMHVEFFSINLKEKNQTGKGTEDSPFVENYRIKSYQTGVLLKVR